MGGGQKIIGLWRNHPDAHDPVHVDVSINGDEIVGGVLADPATTTHEFDTRHHDVGAFGRQDDSADVPTMSDASILTSESDQTGAVSLHDPDWDEVIINEPSLWQRLFIPALLILGLTWAGFFVWSIISSTTPLTSATQWVSAITQLSIPLILLALIYLIVQRSSQAEANRYGQIVRRMEQQSVDIETKLVGLNSYLKTSREELGRQADEVAQFGLKTAQQLQSSTQHIRDALNDGLSASNQLAENSQRAMSQIDGLLAGLPKVDDVATRLTDNLREAGLTAHQHGSAIEAQIAALGQISQRASAAMGEQESLLQDKLDAIGTKAAATKLIIEQTCLSAETSYTDVSARAQVAFHALKDETDAFSASHIAHIEDAHSRVTDHTTQSLNALTARLSEADAAVEILTERIREQEAYSQKLTMQLTGALQQIDAEFVQFDRDGRERLDKLADAVATLEQHTEGLTSKVQLGSSGANQLIGKSESLLVALDSVTRELEESLPSAFARLDERLTASRGELVKISPELERVEAVAEATLGRLRESDNLIKSQHSLINQTESKSTVALGVQKDALVDLEKIIAQVNEQAVTLSEQTGPRMVEALVRVRETAMQASERARDALNAVIPESAGKLGEASAAAMVNAVGDKVEQKLAEIDTATARTVAATNAATDQLLQRIDEVGKTSAAIEKRVTEAQSSIEKNDRDTLTRRVALLTESLNSNAIDVAKILSNDVSDVAWDAYLKGDRGVFTRRAVRLISNSESKEILRHYEEDIEFRTHVNRYIHDFESILRNLLGTRDGSALSVTLLSSDMGKLYVALAQAIERLRA